MRKAKERINPEVRTGRIQEAQKRYSLGRDTVRSVAKECGAVIKIGKICLYDFQRMDEYLSALAGKEVKADGHSE